MYYLTDTAPDNGCLRVIPGTHRRRIPLHDALPAAHTDATYTAAEKSVLFSTRPDEVDVPVKAGDLLIGDARLLHAAHANQTGRHRSLLTLWYLPDYDALSESVKAAVVKLQPVPPPGWADTPAGRLLDPLIPRYDGDAQPEPWNRVPGAYLSEPSTST
jgi:ectoine hydroxylase-related dioxygenase (phytanoyl-CoA dioxygenase family)